MLQIHCLLLSDSSLISFGILTCRKSMNLCRTGILSLVLNQDFLPPCSELSFNTPPHGSEEWKVEYNTRTSAERCNKREKIDYKLEDGRYRSSMMWYCRLFAIMMCQHLDAWTLPKTSRLKDSFEQAA